MERAWKGGRQAVKRSATLWSWRRGDVEGLAIVCKRATPKGLGKKNIPVALDKGRAGFEPRCVPQRDAGCITQPPVASALAHRTKVVITF